MPPWVLIDRRERIGLIRLHHPPVNALCAELPAAVLEALQTHLQDNSVDAIVLAGSGQAFMAGADIRELQEVLDGQRVFDDRLQKFLDQVEASPKPLIAGLHGFALGAGLELAMACHWRIAHPSLQLGQPEVDLGLIPGAAGTQRLPRLIGVPAAARLCALGEKISADQALRLELIDAITAATPSEEAFLGEAVRFAQQQTREESPLRRTSEFDERLAGPQECQDELSRLRQEVLGLRPGETAPEHAIAAVAAAASLPYHQGCQRELELFDECLRGPQARALIRQFLAQRRLAERPRQKQVPQVAKLHLVGRLDSQPFEKWRSLAQRRDLPIVTTAIEELPQEVARQASSTGDLVLLLPDISPRESTWHQVEMLAEQLQQVRALASERPVLIDTDSSELSPAAFARFETKTAWPVIWISWTGRKESRAAEVTFAAKLPDVYHDAGCQLLKQLKLIPLRRRRPGPSAVLACHQQAAVSLEQAAAEGVPQDAVRTALRRHGFHCELPLSSDSDASSDIDAETIVSYVIRGWRQAAQRLLAEGHFANQEELDLLSVLSGGFPAFLGGPYQASPTS